MISYIVKLLPPPEDHRIVSRSFKNFYFHLGNIFQHCIPKSFVLFVFQVLFEHTECSIRCSRFLCGLLSLRNLFSRWEEKECVSVCMSLCVCVLYGIIIITILQVLSNRLQNISFESCESLEAKPHLAWIFRVPRYKWNILQTCFLSWGWGYLQKHSRVEMSNSLKSSISSPQFPRIRSKYNWDMLNKINKSTMQHE